MLREAIGDRLTPCLDAVEEVAHMVDDGIELPGTWRSTQVVKVIEPERLAGKRTLFKCVDYFASHRSSVDEQASFRSLEQNAVSTMVENP